MRLTAPNPGVMTGPGTNSYLVGDALSGYIAIDPGPASGNAFGARMAVLAEAMRADPAVRLPGSRRLKARAAAAGEGLRISAALHAEIRGLLKP